ncbi:MAG: ABC transporter ATP-binding protein [Lachnospiraceae bacterium]|nr:ABC transporter ATP-binding protein [Lachnospiraceae bacterium]
MIEVHDLTIRYDDKAVFRAESALFEEGKISAVIGRNGSGKSTLLKALSGQKMYSGSVKIDGKECAELRPMERARKVAYLPQILKSANMDVRTLAEHGRYPYHGSFRRPTEEDRACVEKALMITGMKALEEKNLGQLSGGERQRAYLALVIAQNSSMILLDEPTSFLDHMYREEFFAILQELKKAGKGIVMVCHDLEQSFAYSDRIFLMEDGELHSGMTAAGLSGEEDLLRRNFGVVLKPSEDSGSLYPFVMKR